jgi:WD40 repeat protein
MSERDRRIGQTTADNPVRAGGGGVGRPEKPVDPDAGVVQRFAWQLRQLRERAGNPGYRVLARRAHYSASTLAEAAKGDRLPSLEVALAFVEACEGDQAEWRARWEAASAEAVIVAERPEQRCPYQGLMAFQSEHADWFFGRSSQVARLVDRIGRAPLTLLVGPSGSGKSSLLRAGLAGTIRMDPALAARWRVMLLTPGAHPLEALSDEVAKLSGGQVDRIREALAADPAALDVAVRNALVAGPEQVRALLIVDQFEETFTLCADEEERERFVEALVDAAVGPGRRTTVVLGLRADFLSSLVRLPRLTDALGPDAYQVIGPPSSEDLREIVARPAARAGLDLEPELVSTVIADAVAEPGALPLVSHAMQETWRHHDGALLTLADYRASGGVRGAIAQTAEQLYEDFDPDERAAARRIFLRLTALGHGSEDTRRPIDRGELDGVADEVVLTDVLDRLARARLIVLDDRAVTVAHEALIGAWPRLTRWLADDRDDLVVHRRLTESAQTWAELGSDPGALLRGVQLSAAADWAQSHGDELNQQEASFLAASRALAEAELTAARRRGRLLQRLVAGMAVLLVLAVAAAGLAVLQGRAAQRQERLALAGQLALEARSLAASDPRLAGLLAAEAVRLDPSADTRGALISAAAAPRRLELHVGGVATVAISSDRSLIATAASDGTVALWDPRRGSRLASLAAYTGRALQVAFTRDGRLLVTTGVEGDTRSIGVWDVATRSRIARYEVPDLTGALAVSPDGRLVAAGLRNGGVALYEVSTGERRILAQQHAFISSVSFSADGQLLASAASAAEKPVVYRVSSGEVIDVLDAPRAYNVAFGRSGRILAAGADSDGLYLWDFTGDHAVPLPRLIHPGTYAWTISAPAGGRVAIGDEAGSIALWDLTTGRPLQTYRDRGRTENVSIALSDDGTLLASAGFNGTIVVHDLSEEPFSEYAAEVKDLRVSPDGTTVVAGLGDGTVRTWDPQGRTLATLPGNPDQVEAVAVRPDGAVLAAASRNVTLTLWDVPGRRPLGPRLPHGVGATTDVVFSPDGALMAAATLGLYVWDVHDPAHPVSVTDRFEYRLVTSLAFVPDGRTLVGGSADGFLNAWDVATGKVAWRVNTRQGAVQDVAISPDGRVIATAGDSRTVTLWDAATHTSLAVLGGHTGPVQVLAFSPDGRLLASAGDDHTVVVWDVPGKRRLMTLTGHTARVRGLAFLPDGSLLSGGDDGRIVRWILDPAEATRRVCADGAVLTRDEWAAYLPSRSYERTCGQP